MLMRHWDRRDSRGQWSSEPWLFSTVSFLLTSFLSTNTYNGHHDFAISVFARAMSPHEQPDSSSTSNTTVPLSRTTSLTVPLERTTSQSTTGTSQLSTSRNDHAAILHPGTIKINVKGAFIVDDEIPAQSTEASPAIGPGEHLDEDWPDYKHDTNDIRLPNQSGAVSHVAVDVSCA